MTLRLFAVDGKYFQVLEKSLKDNGEVLDARTSGKENHEFLGFALGVTQKVNQILKFVAGLIDDIKVGQRAWGSFGAIRLVLFFH